MIETIIADRSIDSLFAQTLDLLVAAGNDDAVQLAANYASVDVPAMRAAQSVDAATDIQPQQFAELITLAHARTIGSRGAKDLLPQLFGMVGSVEDLATKQGLIQKSDPAALKAIVDQVISENADQVAECVAGKETVFKYLVGQGMKLSKGSANPAVLEQLLRDEITK